MSLPPLYRGLTTLLPARGEHQLIRENRRPRDTKVIFNICFNLMIERRFGIPIIRRRALFVSGAIEQALKYAASEDELHIGVVEPIGPFRFLYSPKVSDSIDLVRELTERYTDCFYDWQHEICRPLLEDPLITMAAVNSFFETHLEVDSGGFSWSSKTLRQRVLETLDSFSRPTLHHTTSHYTDCDLSAAAEAGAEIMIFDCPQGYMIRPADASLLSDLRTRRHINRNSS